MKLLPKYSSVWNATSLQQKGLCFNVKKDMFIATDAQVWVGIVILAKECTVTTSTGETLT